MDNERVSYNHVVPIKHHAHYNDILHHYSLDPVNIKDYRNMSVPMGPEAEAVVGGSLCLLTFQVRLFMLIQSILYLITNQIKHYFIASASRDSFNASLKSIRVLVPHNHLEKVITSMKKSLTSELHATNMFGPIKQEGIVSSFSVLDHDISIYIAGPTLLSLSGWQTRTSETQNQ